MKKRAAARRVLFVLFGQRGPDFSANPMLGKEGFSQCFLPSIGPTRDQVFRGDSFPLCQGEPFCSMLNPNFALPLSGNV